MTRGQESTAQAICGLEAARTPRGLKPAARPASARAKARGSAGGLDHASRDLQAALAAWLQAPGPSQRHVPHTNQAWGEFAKAVCRSGLAGLVLQTASTSEHQLPDFVEAALSRYATGTAAENLNAMHTVEGVIQAFNDAAVPVMLLKGAALNLTVYPRFDLRPMSDVDLLIRPETAGQALRVLERHGCRRGADLLREDFFPTYHYEVDFMTDSPRAVRIDLHARPLRPLRIARTLPDNALWEGSRVVSVGKARASVPRPELMFIHLAAHAAYHGCSRLLWLYDLKRLVDEHTDDMNWQHVTRRTAEWRLSLPVMQAVSRASSLLGPICPREVMDELAGHRTNWRDRLVLAQAPRDATSPLRHVAVNLLCTPGVRFRLGYLRAFMLPGRKHLHEIYPFRHPGWPVCAHFWRVIRAVGGPWRRPGR